MTTQHHTCARCGVADEDVKNYRAPLQPEHYQHIDCVDALKRDNAALRVRERDLEKCVEEALATCAAKQQEIERLNRECDRAVGEAKFNADVIDRLRAAMPRVAVEFAVFMELHKGKYGSYTEAFAAFLQTDAGKAALNEQPPRDG